MNRGSFLKSVATLIAAPSVLAEIKEPVSNVWVSKAEWDFEQKWWKEQELEWIKQFEYQIWYGRPKTDI